MSGESATVTAIRLGLQYRKLRGASGQTLTNDQLLDLAVSAYWKNRNLKRAGAA